MEKWMTIAEAAELLGVSKSFVYQEHGAGRMRFLVRRGCSKGYRVAMSEVERWRAEEWREAPRGAAQEGATAEMEGVEGGVSHG